MQRRIVFFTGKGGVGKSTLAWATALACSRAGARVVVASWNPFAAETPPDWSGGAPVRWVPLETLACFKEYVLQVLKFETIYDKVLDNKVLRTFVLAAPGLAETVVAGKLWDLVEKGDQDLVVVDLPASGHAISFFQSPLGIRKIFPVGYVHRESGKILRMLEERWCRLDLVALPEELPMTECLQLKQKLETLHPFHFGFLHVNQCQPPLPLPEREAEDAFPAGVRVAVERFRTRRADEEEAMGIGWDIHLPVVRLPRYAQGSGAAVVAEAARTLETL